MPAFNRALLLALLSFDVAFSFRLHSRHTYLLKDSHEVPTAWSRVGSAHPEFLITLQTGLKQSRFDELKKQLYKVSTPSHERYGKHLTPAEVNKLVKPSKDALNDVHDWLESHGVDRAQSNYSSAKDWIKAQLPVSNIERLLDTQYFIYEYEDGTQLVRAAGWSLPSHLHEHIETVQPTNSFFRPKPHRRSLDIVQPDIEIRAEPSRHQKEVLKVSQDATLAQVCNTTPVTPICLRTLYGTIDYNPKMPGKNKVALNNYDGQTSNRSDVAVFLSQYRPDAVPAAQTFTIDVLSGGADQQSPINALQAKAGSNTEDNLDAELLLSFVYPTPLIAYNTGGKPPPYQEDASEGPNDINEINISCVDTGPYLEWLQYVLAQDDIPQVSFLPSFPSTCPYVTSVGATKGFNPEVAASDPSSGFASGGGFSNYFLRSEYQSGSVPAYISGIEPEYSGLYRSSGRAYPDVAAQGQQVATTWNGKEKSIDGASASTPIVAGVLTLVNDALIAAGKSPLGFLNPWLYSEGYKTFTDITSGSTAGCNTTCFPAKEGWDAVTGFGTPDFLKLKAMALECHK